MTARRAPAEPPVALRSNRFIANVEAGVRVATGRRPLDAPINLSPMIELLVAGITFLLVTAVRAKTRGDACSSRL